MDKRGREEKTAVQRPLHAQFTHAIVDWYQVYHRDLPWRQDRDPYHVWVSEIMLQQTRVEAVREYYHRFMTALPTVEKLAAADEDTLLKLWQGLGYYNRIRNMHRAAQVICETYGGRFPETMEEIRALPGIGDYTAGAIASICFNAQTPAVDGNVLRVMARLMADDSDIGAVATKKRYTALLATLYPDTECGAFTQGLIELGALICVPKGAPLCDRCPVAEFCRGYQSGIEKTLPYKAPKKARRREAMTVFVLRCQQTDLKAEKARGPEADVGGERFAVRKRPKKVLLAGLYEFPHVQGHLSAEEALTYVEHWGCHPLNLTRQREYTHVFTHVEWEMIGYYIDCGRMPERLFAGEGNGDRQAAEAPLRWVSREEMQQEVPLPSAFGYFWTE